MRGRRSYMVVATVLALGLAACTSDGEDPEDPADLVEENGDDSEDGADGEDGEDGAAAPADSGEGVLDQVRARGSVVCGVNDAVPGFGVTTADGTFEGFDVDFCRAIAAAVLGDAEAVDYVPLTAEARFTALQSGEIDVLVRNTTWTATRDDGEGAAFAETTFYDGQGMMVPADA
ncbi:MAG: transporter substrate-binding domain-containing protein, partial [Nitriliruptoraceae bacterium]